MSGSNPNNCATCTHRQAERAVTPNSAAWCYMFKAEPTDVCLQHTGRRQFSIFDELKRFLQDTQVKP